MATKGLGKARNALEEAKVEIALRTKYPQMYRKDWVKRLKKDVGKELKSRKSTVRTKATSKGVKRAGVTEKELSKLRD